MKAIETITTGENFKKKFEVWLQLCVTTRFFNKQILFSAQP